MMEDSRKEISEKMIVASLSKPEGKILGLAGYSSQIKHPVGNLKVKNGI